MLLRACLSSGEEAHSAWRSIESELDIDRAGNDVGRVLPLLGESLHGQGWDTPVLPRLRGMRRKAWMLNQILISHAGGVVRTLDEADISTIVLKGCSIATRYYADVGLRPMGDIDIMVPAARIRAAVELLVARGWHDQTERRPGGTVFRHAHGYYLSAGPHVGCDLHWTIGEHMLLGPDEDPTSSFWLDAQPFDLGGIDSLAPSDSAQLLHVILHGAQPGSLSRLQWIADAVMITRKAEVDWDRLEDLAVRIRDTIRIADALDYVSAYVPGLIPSRVVTRLRAYPVPRFERIEYALASREAGNGVAGMFPATFATYVRETRGWGIGRRVRLFPTFLQEVWELDRLADVPGAAMRKASATLRSRRP
jgi:hypothetical protein